MTHSPIYYYRDPASTHEDELIDETQVIANFQSKPSRSGRTIKTFILGQPGATSTVTTSTGKCKLHIYDTENNRK